MSKGVCYNNNKMKRKIGFENGPTDFKFNVYIIFTPSHYKSINYKRLQVRLPSGLQF